MSLPHAGTYNINPHSVTNLPLPGAIAGVSHLPENNCYSRVLRKFITSFTPFVRKAVQEPGELSSQTGAQLTTLTLTVLGGLCQKDEKREGVRFCQEKRGLAKTTFLVQQCFLWRVSRTFSPVSRMVLGLF